MTELAVHVYAADTVRELLEQQPGLSGEEVLAKLDDDVREAKAATDA